MSGRVLQEYPTIQNGVATTERTLKEQPKPIRALRRARAKASRQFHENPPVPIDVIAKVLHVDKNTARETYFFPSMVLLKMALFRKDMPGSISKGMRSD